MVKEKLQICLSFKHTQEEEELYIHVISQSDKSAFLKNLIRNSMNAGQSQVYDEVKVEPKTVVIEKAEPIINHGRETVNKFLA